MIYLRELKQAQWVFNSVVVFAQFCACRQVDVKLQQFLFFARFRLLSCVNAQSEGAIPADRRICPVR